MASLEDKLEHLKSHLVKLVNYENILAFSGGKDSMLLLSILKDLGHSEPVLAFPYFWSPHQLEFIKKAITELKITLVFYRPSLVHTSQEHIVAKYSVAGRELPVIMDVIPGKACGLDVVNNSVKGVIPQFHWQRVIVGSKKSDKHDRAETLSFKEFPEIVAPLWGWTDEEVLEVIKKEGYLYDTRVYDDEDSTADTGNFVGCMNCFTDIHTFCPKVNTTIKGLYYDDGTNRRTRHIYNS